MCGIAGAWLSSRLYPEVKVVLNKMAHRGPDAQNFFEEGPVQLYHSRLSIIDISQAANQPMKDSSGRFVLIFNGEIYNYRELRKLVDYPWQNHSDTEVLLALLIRFGNEALNLLEGMFALALFDREQKTILLARDRLGKKPLYYANTENGFFFASEVRTLIAMDPSLGVAGRQELSNWLHWQTIPKEGSILQKVDQIRPGSCVEIRHGKLSSFKVFWALEQHLQANYLESPDFNPTQNKRERLRTLLEESVEKRLVSDVPFACFLSGGVDSSIITAMASQALSEPLNTFSLVFKEKEFSEQKYSKMVADRYKTNHHEILVHPNDLLDLLPEALAACDHPSGDGLNTYMVSKKTREAGFKMALSGLGGDEWFLGYQYFFQHDKWRQRAHWSELIPPAGLLPFKLRKGREIIEGYKHFYRGGFSLQRIVWDSWTIMNKMNLPRPNIRPEAQLEIQDHLYSQDSVNEWRFYTQPVLLRDSDQYGMACGLEIRAPFMDHKLIEFALQMTDSEKTSGRPKELLIDVCKDLLPEEIYNRPKQGFALPWEHWMRSELRDFCNQRIKAFGERTGSAITGKQWDKFLAGNNGIGWSRWWSLVSLEDWLQRNNIRID